MTFLIADTFTDSLARLTGDEQKAAKTTAFDLQMNPASPGLSFHRLDKAKDKNFWSVRVNARRAPHRPSHGRQPAALLRRPPRPRVRLGRAAQARDASEDRRRAARRDPRDRQGDRRPRLHVPRRLRPSRRSRALFDAIGDDELLGFGVPAEWMNDVRAADEDTILTLATHLPAEAAEALLEIATGGKPRYRAIRSRRAS